ncbi:MAG: sugar ABC transporter ATP-binding protein [Candidatus Levyibacteriota bacterium]
MTGADSAPPEPSAATPLLELRHVSKAFPGVRALDDVSLEIRAGEVHMLLGENGAGKSSLIKVLCGAYRPDGGEFLHRGQPIAIASPADARRLGIAVIFQEFSLVPFLDLAQNIFLGREPHHRLLPLVDRDRMHRDAAAILASLGLDYDTRALAVDLGVAQQQMVEIAKALSQQAGILVMDEPTAALSDRETDALFAVIRQLRAAGVAIVYISHRLNEVFELGDRITVLRDGRRVASMPVAGATPDQLIGLMVGRAVGTVYTRRHFATPGEPALELRGLRTCTGVDGVDLVVRSGEIVGLSGLVGAGRTEVARAVFGADPIAGGEVMVFGRRIEGGPERVAARGVALIPENRKHEGLALKRSTQDNLLAASLWKLFPRGGYRTRRAGERARELIARLRITPAQPRRHARVLSGGNQQKIVIGKWLAAGCRLYMFDEPTRGIDVGAKSEIFALIEDLVAQGAAVLLISSELAEIVHVCDRAYVMREGRIRGELARTELSEEAILRLAMHEA